MFKSPAQRFAYFANLKKKQGLGGSPNSMAPKQPKIEQIGQMPSAPAQPPNPQQNVLQSIKAPTFKFQKLKKLIKIK